MTTSLAERQKAAEMAGKFPQWIVWATAQGSPVATRAGNQKPPEPDDGLWSQTIIADDWGQLETALAEQATYDAARQAEAAARLAGPPRSRPGRRHGGNDQVAVAPRGGRPDGAGRAANLQR